MANQNCKKYGFTALFPIKSAADSTQLRIYLRSLDCNPFGSPLSEVPIIHMARLIIIDQLPYQGLPAKYDTLKSAYLLFLCEFDGDSPDILVNQMRDKIPSEVGTIWGHCRAFPGLHSADDLIAYFERCQIDTTLFLADRPKDSVVDILKALRYRAKFSELVIWFQQQPRPIDYDKLKRRINELFALENSSPHPGSL